MVNENKIVNRNHEYLVNQGNFGVSLQWPMTTRGSRRSGDGSQKGRVEGVREKDKCRDQEMKDRIFYSLNFYIRVFLRKDEKVWLFIISNIINYLNKNGFKNFRFFSQNLNFVMPLKDQTFYSSDSEV